MNRKRWVRLLVAIGLVCLLAVNYCVYLVTASLPPRDGDVFLAGLKAQVTVEFDRFDIPTIRAENREDAFYALGFLVASDRMFQMDLMRRKSAGRLAEIFGQRAVAFDKQQRSLGLTRAARDITAALPHAQRRVLFAYTAGVNGYLEQRNVLPPEFLALNYTPAPWTPEDSMLVALGMFQSLTWREDEERMLTVMEKCLPAEVTAFLTPDSDVYSEAVLGGDDSHRPLLPVPTDALARLRRVARPASFYKGQVRARAPAGSNSWVVAGTKTADGRAILASDMHLGLGIPNIWYRAALHYAEMSLFGLTLPGVPLVVAGSNGHVAWGFTNALSDTLDLVLVHRDPADPTHYKTPSGWKPYEIATETIHVRGGPSVLLKQKHTIWGPVSPTPIQGRETALKWSALDPAAVDLGLLSLDRATTIEQAMAALNRAGIPSMNATLAGRDGRIGWTLAGKIPLRRGFDGSVSRSWADGAIGWHGFIPAEALPRVVAPASGYLVSANQRMVGKAYPFPLGHNYENGYRAHRIGERLGAMQAISEQTTFELQLDTRSEFFDFYRDIALSALSDYAVAARPERLRLRRSLEAWDGRAAPSSVGLPLVYEFRKSLMGRIFPAYFGGCLGLDRAFHYHWFEMDTPLRSLLSARHPATLPDPDRYSDWAALILEALDDAANTLQRRFSSVSLENLTWGRFNGHPLAHPLGVDAFALGTILNLGGGETGGCGHCVNVSSKNYGVTERMVISPGHLDEAVLHMPGGQSGHFLSRHYRDQHRYWVEGLSLPLLPESALNRLRFLPRAANTPPLGSVKGGIASRNSSTD